MLKMYRAGINVHGNIKLLPCTCLITVYFRPHLSENIAVTDIRAGLLNLKYWIFKSCTTLNLKCNTITVHFKNL